MKLYRVWIILLTVLLCLSAVSCRDRGGEGEEIEPEVMPPLASEPEEDEERAELLDDLRSTFDEVTPTDPSEFEVAVGEDGAAILAYSGVGERVVVPAEIDGVPVTAIGTGVFANVKTMKTLYLPDSIRRIGENALKGCRELTALRTPLLGRDAEAEQLLGYLFGASEAVDNPRDVPSSLVYLELGGGMRELGDRALFDCNDLICLSLPDTLERIGSYALYNCAALESVNTNAVRELAAHALDSCSSLRTLTFSRELERIGLGALEGCLSLRRLTLPFVGGSATENGYLGYVFGAAVPDFSEGFYPTDLAHVVLLEGCTRVGDYAFYGCDTLRTVTLPEGVESIGVRAFYGCDSITALTLPESLRSLREAAFFGCRRLGTLTLPEGVESIGINAFYGCISLTEVTLPQTLTALPASCFADCTALERITLGGVRRVGAYAFRHCVSLREVITAYEVEYEKGNDLVSRENEK